MGLGDGARRQEQGQPNPTPMTVQQQRETLARLGFGFHSYDVRTGEVVWDAQLYDYWGIDPAVPVTYDLWAASLHPDDRAMAEASVRMALDAGGDGRYAACYRVINAVTGVERLIEANGIVEFAHGKPVVLRGTVHEVRPSSVAALLSDDRTLALARAAEADAMVDAVPIGIALFDTDFRFKRVNRHLADMNARSVEEHEGRMIEDILPEETVAALRAMQPALLAGQPCEAVEISGENLQTGLRGSALVSYSPIVDGQRHVSGFVGSIIDISERKRAEERELLLAREVDHRAKNLLMVVQSVANMTRASTVDAYRAAVTARIGALARAHALLASNRWSGVDLRTLVEEELAPYCGADATRCSISGPRLDLRPAAAQSLAMVLHELATNAAKYGALSRHGGHVGIDWRLTGDRLDLDWQESGGPPVSAPRGRGFGSTVIHATVVKSFAGALDLDWQPGGLQAKMAVPLSSIQSAVAAPPGPAPASGTARPAESDTSAPAEADRNPIAGTTIFVAEDEPLIALDLENILGSAGCEVIGSASTVREGLALLGSIKPDIALLDFNLKGETSLPLAAQLQADGVPFAICTGYDRATSLPSELNAAPRLAKPYGEDEVTEMVARLRAARR